MKNDYAKIFTEKITPANLMVSERDQLDDNQYTGYGMPCGNTSHSCDECCNTALRINGSATHCIICGHKIPKEDKRMMCGGQSIYRCTNCGVVLLTCSYGEHDGDYVITGYLKGTITGLVTKDDII